MIPLLILLGTVAYAGAIVAFGRGTLHLNSNLFGTAVNFLATLAPLGLYALVSQQRHTPAGSTKTGLIWALIGGICIGLFTIAIAYVFSVGENVSFVTPLIYGGAVLIASLVGILFFKEKVSSLQLIGLLLIVAGIVSVAASTWKTGGAA
jgi:uncharacterized membrane protein